METTTTIITRETLRGYACSLSNNSARLELARLAIKRGASRTEILWMSRGWVR